MATLSKSDSFYWDRLSEVIALLAGLALPFAFSPYSYEICAVISPALLLWVTQTATRKQAAWRGWLFGLGAFGMGVSWVYVSIHTYGNTGPFLAGVITALFVVVLAIFIAVQSFLMQRFFPAATAIKTLVIFPTLWVLFEWLRSWVFSGFPWLYLGYSQTDGWLRGFAPIVGVYGLSWLLAFSGGLLIYIISQLKRRQLKPAGLSVVMIGVLWIVSYGLGFIHWTTRSGKPVVITLIQGDIAQEVKWDPNYYTKTITRYLTMTEPYWTSGGIVIWPEAAIPLALPQSQDMLDELSLQAQENKVTLITGVPVQTQDGRYFNSLIAVGSGSGTYYKRHLVPFGEYVPLEKLLRGLIGFFNIPMSNFVSGPSKQLELSANSVVLAPFICYEIAFPDLVLASLPQADALLTVSNDTWFGHSIGPNQHLQIARMRAMETGRYLIRSTNNGITAIINPNGSIETSAPQFRQTVLTGSFYVMKGWTPIAFIGNIPLIILWLLVLIIIGRRTARAAS